MIYIPIDLYRGSYSDLVNSSVMKNPNALSVIGDTYVYVGEDLYIGQKSLTAQRFVSESSLGEQSDIIFASVENPKAESPKPGKGFIITGYKRDEHTGEKLTRLRNILEADLPEHYDNINVKVLNASYEDVSMLNCTSTATIRTLEILDPSFRLGYKLTGYDFDSSYLLDVSSYTMLNYRPYIKSERSQLFTGEDPFIHRGTLVENRVHGNQDDNAFNVGNFGFKTFHEYYLTASDSSIGYSPNPNKFTDPVDDETSDDIEVMLEEGTYMGDYCNEMTIVANNNSVYKVLKTLLQKRVPPIYVGPTHGSSGSGFKTYEVGEKASIEIKTSYTNPTPKELGATKENGYVTSRFDALTSKYNIDVAHGGKIISSKITKNGTSGLFNGFVEDSTEYSSTIESYKASGTISKGSMTFTVTVNTETGPILRDNFLESNAVDDSCVWQENGLFKAKGFYSTVKGYGYAKDADDIVMPPYESEGPHGAYSEGMINNHDNTFVKSYTLSGQYKYYMMSSNDKFEDTIWTKDLIFSTARIIKSGFVPNKDDSNLSIGQISFPSGARQCVAAIPSFFTKGSLKNIKNEFGVNVTESFVFKGTFKAGGINGNDDYLIDYDLFVLEANAGLSAATSFTFEL